MKLNGNLVFNSDATGEIQHVYIERLAAAPTFNGAHKGRLYFNTTDSLYYFNDGASYVPFATGGNAAALQTEVNAIETSLGAGINGDGTFNADGFTDVTGVLVDPTSFTNAIQQLATAVNSNNELAELDDVSLGVLTDNDLLQWDNGTSMWNNVAIGSASGVQAYDAGLDALAAFNTNGIVVQTANNTFAGRSLTAPAEGLTITNPDGVSGSPTFALANDLAALEGLSTTGYVVRTGDGTATTRSITGNAGRVAVTNGDGVSSDTSIDLATVTPGSGGTFQKFSVDSYGRISDVTAVVASDITSLVDATYVNVTGDTMSGALNMGNNQISGLAAGTAGTDAVNKNQLDAAVTGLSWKQAVRAATTADIDLATALENGDTLDGVTLATGDRVLVKDQADLSENGIYIVQASGAAVRATDMDAAAEFSGATVFVAEGTANADSGWTQVEEVTTVGTDDVTFVQFTGSGTYTAGTGLALSGNTFNVNLGAGIVELPSDEVGIHLYDAANGALALTTTGSDRSTAAGAMLYLILDGAGALEQTSAGLKIGAAAVTNAMLVNDGVTTNADTGTGTLDLGGDLEIAGSSTQGIATSVTGSVFTVAGIDASTTQKGVASFNTSHFTVSSGAVSLEASLDDLTNVSTADAAATGDLLQKSAGDWVAVSAATVAGGINLGDLADVGTATPTDGHVLVGDGSAWGNQKVYHLYTSGAPATTHSVTHNIGQQYCNVTVVDSTDEVVIPQSITFNSTTALTVTFTSAIDCKVVVMGIA